MAINYTTLFTRFGRLIKYANEYLAEQSNLEADLDDIEDEFTDRRDLVRTLSQSYSNYINGLQSRVTALKGVVDGMLRDLRNELDVASTGTDVLLTALAERMNDDIETVNQNSVSSTPGSISGTGNGELLTDLWEPINSGDNEAITDEVMVVRCVNDSYNGTSEGGELFTIIGNQLTRPANDVNDRGNGVYSGLTAIGSRTLLSNGTFESYTTANEPDDWTIDDGTAGTHIFEEDSGDEYRGDSALKLTADGAQATVGISQSVLSALVPGRRYVLCARMKKGSGTFSTGSNLQLDVYINGSSEASAFNDDPDNLTTSYALKSVFFTVPDDPASATVRLQWTSADSENAKDLFIDDVFLAPVTAFAGVNWVVVPGATPFVRDDEWEVTNSNDYAGVFQSFFGRFYGRPLPSDGSPSINDSLAT